MNKLLALVGPTGSGKTETAVALSRKTGAEIVAVDSMQVYRGMDIGTGKPSPELLRLAPHHGIDLAEPEEEFDALRFARAVRPVIESALSRGRPVVLTAGCGLYLRVLLKGMCSAPGKDPEVRARLLEQASLEGPQAMHARLAGVDPEAARRIHCNDVRRVVRALEVFEVTGRPITSWQGESAADGPSLLDCRMVGIRFDREELYRRIETRIDSWLAGGWVEEARALAARNLSQTAREALGYRELFDHFEGRAGWEDTRALIHRNTRRYAKRQLSWFRHEPGVSWLTPGEILASEIAA